METENTQTPNSQDTDTKGSSRTVVTILILGMLFLGGYYVYDNFFKSTEIVDDTDLTPVADDSNSVDDLTVNSWMWKETQMGNDDMVTPKNPSQFVLTFMDDGTFGTTTDCNSGSGSYTSSDDGSLTLGQVATTQMFCEGSQETEYYKELGDVASYVLEGGNLYMSMKMDAGIMEFTPVSN